MAANKNGLALPQAYAAPSKPFYVEAGENAVIVAPTLQSVIKLAADPVNGALDVDGAIYVDGANAGAYAGAVNITPGSTAGGVAAGITIREAAGPSTIVEIGANAQSNNLLYIAGASGVGQVYDDVYNQPVNPTAVASSTGALPVSPSGLGFTYTPNRTGAYMLQVNINVRNADGIPVDGFIEWVMSAAGSEVQYVSNTLKSLSIAKVAGMDDINGVPGGLAEPTDYSFSNLCFLTAGVATTFNITTARNSTAGGPQWSIQNYDARLIQMC